MTPLSILVGVDTSERTNTRLVSWSSSFVYTVTATSHVLTREASTQRGLVLISELIVYVKLIRVVYGGLCCYCCAEYAPIK